MWLFCAFILVMAVLSFVEKALWLGIIFIFAAGVLSPIFQDWLWFKLWKEKKVDYGEEVKGIFLFLGGVIILFFALIVTKKMVAKKMDENIIFEQIEGFIKILMFVFYYIMLFMYQKGNKHSKYILFGTIYFFCIILSYIPLYDKEIAVSIINILPNNPQLELSILDFMFETIIQPIKEAILTYIIFDTVLPQNKIECKKEQDTYKQNFKSTEILKEDKKNEFKVSVNDNRTGINFNYIIKIRSRK